MFCKFSASVKHMIGYVEDDVDKLRNSDFFKAYAIVSDEIDHGKADVLLS